MIAISILCCVEDTRVSFNFIIGTKLRSLHVQLVVSINIQLGILF